VHAAPVPHGTPSSGRLPANLVCVAFALSSPYDTAVAVVVVAVTVGIGIVMNQYCPRLPPPEHLPVPVPVPVSVCVWLTLGALDAPAGTLLSHYITPDASTPSCNHNSLDSLHPRCSLHASHSIPLPAPRTPLPTGYLQATYMLPTGHLHSRYYRGQPRPLPISHAMDQGCFTPPRSSLACPSLPPVSACLLRLPPTSASHVYSASVSLSAPTTCTTAPAVCTANTPS
jgi:hypothetical protein